MSKSALLDIIPEARKKLIYHEEDGKTYIETRQDATYLLAAAKVLAEHADGQSKKGPRWHFKGFVPDAVIDQSFIEGWFHDQARWKAWLGDRDNRAWTGRL